VNAVRMITKSANDYRHDCLLFVNEFKEFDMREFLLQAIELKDKYRKGELNINGKFVHDLIHKSIQYLEKLKSFLE